MKKEDFFNLELPKWPAFIVKGKKITKEQAVEIIIRTDDFEFSSNDHSFVKSLYEYTYGLEHSYESMYHVSSSDFFKDKDGKIDWDTLQKERDRVKKDLGLVYPLEYLRNHRITTSWINGPHGWCNWDGYIGCNNYNIGKYPTIKEVYEEWVIIAKTFPFLELKCQLLDRENSEENQEPVVEFSLKDGKVKIIKPKELLDHGSFDITSMVNGLSNPYRERGCTLNQFKEAVSFVKNKISKQEKETIS